jgi:[acyl-carrier-protein] S-malonyltransferase
MAGHSVGEITAAAIAGVFSEVDALRLVRTRGVEMAKAAIGSESGMSAVLGGVREDVLQAIEDAGLVAANDNGGGQIVAAGSKSGIEKLVAEGPQGSKVIPLSVAGAFHTSYMQPAVGELEAFTSSIEISNPEIKLWSNENGQLVSDGSEFINLLVGQVANSVRWDLCMEAMVNAGVTAVIEVSPAGTLAGLAKRGMPGVEIVALKEPKDLELAQDLINRSVKKD